MTSDAGASAKAGAYRFDLGLFECFSSPLAGPACCFANCCCEPCVQYDLLSLSGARNAEGIFAADLFGTVLQSSGNELLSLAGAGMSAGADLSTRQRVARQLGIAEGGFESFCAACCCPLLSNAQLAHELSVRRGGGVAYSCVGLRMARK